MSGLLMKVIAALAVVILLIGIVSALPSPARLRSRRDIAGYGDPMDSELSQQDMLLLQKLLAPPPTKRQLCRSGFSYNPVYGGCRASLGLLRGRSRSGRF